MGTPLIHSFAGRALRSCTQGLTAVLILLLLGSCASFDGQIRPVEDPALAAGRTRAVLPISAAIVVDAVRKQQKVSVNRSLYKVYPDITDVLSKQLEVLFTSVDVVEESLLGESLPPYLLYPEVSSRLDYSVLNVTLTWRVVESVSRKTVSRFTVEGSAETEKSLMENLTGRSMDIASAMSNDKAFSGALNAAVSASLARIRKTVQQPSGGVATPATAVSSRPLVAASKTDTTPPVIVVTSPETTRGLAVREKSPRIAVAGRASDESGVAEVTINGSAATLDALGNFSGEALLRPGSNEIVIVATDTRNNAASVRLQVTRESVAPAVQRSASSRKVALLIGINNYRHLDRLKTAVGDVRAVARVLADSYGYETRLLLDEQATHDAIMRELNQIRERITPDDKLLIYYAGHGILEQATDASYWLPYDAEPKDDTKWLDSKRISDHLKRMSTRQILVVADSCYSGTISRSISAELSKGDLRENYLKKLQSKPSRILIASGGNEPVSDSGGGSHSIFASVFIESLRQPPAPVFTAGELLTNVIKESVAGRSAQTPEHKIIRNSGHDSGDFVFEKIR